MLLLTLAGYANITVLILLIILSRENPGIRVAAGLFFPTIFLILNVAPSFDNRWTDRNVNCYINTVGENISTAKNFVNFG